MVHTYAVEGMTCAGCKAAVERNLSVVSGVDDVSVDLEKSEAKVTSQHAIELTTLKDALPSKYILSEKNIFSASKDTAEAQEEKGKWQQLKPLFLILVFLALIATSINYPDFVGAELMLDFMGLFFLIFSLFKLFDLPGFATSFRMYDPLAKQLTIYGYVYPFIEVVLGILLLMRIEVSIVLGVSLAVLTLTTIGVSRVLLRHDDIQCACLGTVLDLPMTEATFVENALMITMGIVMIFGWI